MPDSPKVIPSSVRRVILALSALLLISGVGGAVTGQVVPPKPAWALIAFEIVIVLASVFGVLIALGRVRQAPSLGVLCVAGATLVGTVLGYLAVKDDLKHLPLKPWLLARLGAAFVLGACSIVIMLGTNRTAWRTLIKAGVFALPLIGVAGWYRLAHCAPLNKPLPGFSDVLRLSGIGAVAIVCAVCVCAVVHLTIRAFVIADEAARAS